MSRVTSYTKARIDQLLLGKQPAGNYAASTHSHTADQITDLSARFAQLLPATVPTKEYVDTKVYDLQQQSASTEDLFMSFTRDVNITAQTTIPLFVAPFAMRLSSLAISSFQVTTNVTTNDTNYWVSRIRYTRPSQSNTAVNIATKTTRDTAGAEPAGEALTMMKAWKYNTGLLASSAVQADDIISMVFAPIGAPTAITGPLVITLGYVPL